MPRPQKGVDEAAVLGKVNGHILPLFCCLAMLCYLDRVNLAFAARQLNEDLGFSKAVYGLGSGALGMAAVSHCIYPILSHALLRQVTLTTAGVYTELIVLAEQAGTNSGPWRSQNSTSSIATLYCKRLAGTKALRAVRIDSKVK